MSKFCEPWEIEDGECINSERRKVFSSGGSYGLCDMCEDGGFTWEEYEHRTVACVNALAGVENPEAVKELLKAARLLQSFTKDDNVVVPLVQLAVIMAGFNIQFTEDESCEK